MRKIICIPMLGFIFFFVQFAYAQQVTDSFILSYNFTLHNFDSVIKEVLGFQVSSVNYFAEMGTITPEQSSARKNWEPVGCYPFYLVKEGEVIEAGYNCMTFFCVGYLNDNNNIQCRDINNKVVGGSVMMDSRKNRVSNNSANNKIAFDPELPIGASNTINDYMSETSEKYECIPFYIVGYGTSYESTQIVIGRGNDCPGQNAYYEEVNDCQYIWTDLSTVDFTTCMPKYRNNVTSSASNKKSTANKSSTPAQTNSTQSNFSDISSDYYASKEINSLYNRGILQGYEDGTYKPNKTVNRAELNKLLIAGLHATEVKGESDCFPDVKSEWFSKYVCAAKRLGWISGYSDGSFKPANSVNRAEAIKILISSLTDDLTSSAVLPQDVSSDAWYAPYVRKAVELGIITESTFSASSDLSRVATAIWIYRGTQ